MASCNRRTANYCSAGSAASLTRHSVHSTFVLQKLFWTICTRGGRFVLQCPTYTVINSSVTVAVVVLSGIP
eukprot:2263756-Rhodomonas_salina.1